MPSEAVKACKFCGTDLKKPGDYPFCNSNCETWWKQQALDRAAFDIKRARIKKPVVATFGRFQPPTVGHARLVDLMRYEAARRKAPVIVFPSPKQDKVDNPLAFPEKVRFLRQLFDGVWVNENGVVKTPLDALAALSKMGFDSVCMVVGNDQVESFKKFGKYFDFKKYEVVPVTRDDMAATKLREAAARGDWQTFRQGTPTKHIRLVQQIYETVRSRLHGKSVSTLRHESRDTAVLGRIVREGLQGRAVPGRVGAVFLRHQRSRTDA